MRALHTQDAMGAAQCSSCGKRGTRWEYWKADSLGTDYVNVLAVFCDAKCSSDYHARNKEVEDG